MAVGDGEAGKVQPNFSIVSIVSMVQPGTVNTVSTVPTVETVITVVIILQYILVQGRRRRSGL